MPIHGIAQLNYAVKDLGEANKFLDVFGLSKVDETSSSSTFEVLSGQRVYVRHLGDPALPPSSVIGDGVHEAIWAIADQPSFDRLLADLSRDHQITTDSDGTAHFVTDFGQAIGLRLQQFRPVVSSPSPFNAPGVTNRLNAPRKWSTRAIPKTISHAVWGVPDVDEVFAFYRDRLNFRLSDVQKGFGLYLRAPRSTNHHSVFLADANLEMLGFSGKLQFHHANFGLEDIDEIMVGKNYLERHGYDTKGWGFGRHRLSSEAFLYVPSPLGGQAEYGADCDQVDDRWKPRVWEANFGAALFVHDMPEFLSREPEWDVTYATPETSRFLPFDHK
ncbi:Glyoxalase/Bleomycin resistance protein/Dioxygenase superfamily protein [Sphingobium faniae]|nr:Glyoxalase/Bleomycin resistance protein/Dioxygenase superfamily protein [Sphingobium faniae]